LWRVCERVAAAAAAAAHVGGGAAHQLDINWTSSVSSRRPVHACILHMCLPLASAKLLHSVISDDTPRALVATQPADTTPAKPTSRRDGCHAA
jgi:hypothetical protein